MNTYAKSCILILVVTIVALLLRVGQLQLRPLHTDEAVHGIKFGKLLEEGVYHYDYHEYHGPTLNYFTLIPAKLGSVSNLTDTSESTLRLVPVFFGILLVLLHVLLIKGLGPKVALFSALLCAVSPAMVFYSRYYIQEILLVCFTFGVIITGYRFVRNRNICWAIAVGVFAGLMHATKETCIIAYGSMGLALIITYALSRKNPAIDTAKNSPIRIYHLATAIITAALVSMIFFSSFGTNPDGIVDSIRTYTTYFDRAGQNQFHNHPWYYYLKILTFDHYITGPVWSEGLIILLALTGFVAVVRKQNLASLKKIDIDINLLRFIAIYTLLMLLIYSILPYKTPWCMLGFLHGLIIMAGVGVMSLFDSLKRVFPKVIIAILLIVGVLHLIWQCYLGNTKYYADPPSNPYVYAHTTTDVYEVTAQLEEISRAHPQGKKMDIQYIAPGGDYWPYPWYLRSFSRVHWRTDVQNDIPNAPVILVSASSLQLLDSLEQQVITKLFELPPPGKKNLYLPIFEKYMQLRPRVELRGYIMKDLWDDVQQLKIEPEPIPSSADKSGVKKMKQPDPEISIDDNEQPQGFYDDMHRFAHGAMWTSFEIYIPSDVDATLARQASREAFDELDRLEHELSRFVENSDISRIKNLHANDPLVIGIETFECLQISDRLFKDTNGAFDITVGTLINCWLDTEKGLRIPGPTEQELKIAMSKCGMDLVILDEEYLTVELKADAVQLDLGGIGKGYALDRMAKMLKEWGVKAALIHGGGSTYLAIDSPPGKKGWPLSFNQPNNQDKNLARIALVNSSLSASGLQKRPHILNPRTGGIIKARRAAWAVAPDASTADALSTAFVVMELEEIEQYCSEHEGSLAMIARENPTQKDIFDKVSKYGPWQDGN